LLALNHPAQARRSCIQAWWLSETFDARLARDADERLGERVCIAVSGTVAPLVRIEHLAREGLSKYDRPEYFRSAPGIPADRRR
jgi:hypothetical protein